jgi:hypothetical protein
MDMETEESSSSKRRKISVRGWDIHIERAVRNLKSGVKRHLNLDTHIDCYVDTKDLFKPKVVAWEVKLAYQSARWLSQLRWVHWD